MGTPDCAQDPVFVEGPFQRGIRGIFGLEQISGPELAKLIQGFLPVLHNGLRGLALLEGLENPAGADPGGRIRS
jgi:hypothetical protein